MPLLIAGPLAAHRKTTPPTSPASQVAVVVRTRPLMQET